MKFVTHYTFSPESRNAVIQRFKETGGPPPKGVKMLSRFHAASGNEGWVIAETDDPLALTEWILRWSDHLSFTHTLVVEDEEFVEVLKRGG